MDSSAIVEKYFPQLSAQQKAQFQELGNLYAEWNEKINVISRKDIENIYEKHILHALAIAKFQNLSGKKILDVGTGGGFPGIPLAILFPDAQFTLVDSIGKKIKVVKAVAESLGLENVEAYHQRAEKTKGKFDFVVSRAVTRMKSFLHWINQKIQADNPEDSSGVIALKGGDLEDEMAEIKRMYQEVSISEYFSEAFFDTKKIIFIPF
ncbi:ribosomal RNA small subunit methyltransferase G [Marivirga tractuosa]|uniref:Ribosomal RNA small subunit methyltransferase G n=1 Tax=Marivirga tractuosa (strain ATCC 23168 / DSM 4126 / NBRC 15989 / NCIMB 1408 / VKM B-1430 / H-43) TaxID=643867 RepID=E4TM27_MARTH|nr:16S rRNA (guanine(527)-N(7))-methyltransferase RsmG [Marivirga tractuosa]ADR20318.1 16S rRNA m(7)G-527 methyltransferase [Marivirga tractuosa DSM 4126]BDD15240.1 ribosomal RNA small subunit methyltransferase G [Marivirga tractuosa]